MWIWGNAYYGSMKVAVIQISNWKSFADTGQIELDKINVLVGRNNGGKSAFIRAMHQMQAGAAIDHQDIRLNTDTSAARFVLVGNPLAGDIARHFSAQVPRPDNSAVLTVTAKANGAGTPRLQSMLAFGDNAQNFGEEQIPNWEPKNFVYTYFSKRKVAGFDRGVDIDRSRSVSGDLRHLVAKVDRLASPGHPRSAEYLELCQTVLGFPITAYPAANGKQAGIQIGNYDSIPIEAMGEGVSSQLGLITDLCMADGNLFLIEELENDIHPEGLKKLLEVIVAKSQNNQFIISTHSNVVVKHLGAAPNSRILSVSLSDFETGAVPTSTISPVENTAEARIAVLRELGYELYDFDLNDGWLILEESSAQVVIRKYLIPWFVPRLSRIQIVAAGGIGKVEPAFEDFRRLFLYAHLETHYKGRAWVVVDGDEHGHKVVEALRVDYATWPSNSFHTWSAADFEAYYPARFAEEVSRVLGLSHKQKRPAKKELLDEVKTWCDSHEDEAKVEFEESAKEVIAYLRMIDQSLFGRS